MNRLVALLVALTVLTISTAAHATTVYDLAADWSATNNPNGTWSYDQGGVPLPYYQNSWAGVPADGWTTTPTGIAPPAWLLLNGDFAGGSAGDVVVHSTNGYDPLASVRWTAPTDGVIDITGESWDVQHSEGRDDMWMLYVNNVLVATRESILGVVKDSADALFANNLAPSQSLTGLAINGGDDVRFIVQETTGNPGHFSGVQLTIAFTPVPTPAALPAGLALLSALAFRRR